MQSGCPYAGAEWVSSPRSQAGVLTLESIWCPHEGPLRSLLESRWYKASEGSSSHTLMSMLCHGTSGQSISFAFSKILLDGVVPFLNVEFGRWALHEDNSMVLMMINEVDGQIYVDGLVGPVLSLRLKDKQDEVCEVAGTNFLQLILLVEWIPVWVFDREVVVVLLRFNVVSVR